MVVGQFCGRKPALHCFPRRNKLFLSRRRICSRLRLLICLTTNLTHALAVDRSAKIGEGEMGEVYQARVTTLDSDVALKVLPEAFSVDPERLTHDFSAKPRFSRLSTIRTLRPSTVSKRLVTRRRWFSTGAVLANVPTTGTFRFQDWNGHNEPAHRMLCTLTAQP